MSQQKLTAWITRYLWTDGILKVDAEKVLRLNNTIAIMYHGYPTYIHGTKNWHRTPEEALARAEEMRLNKIKNLKKQIAKLETMTLEVPK